MSLVSSAWRKAREKQQMLGAGKIETLVWTPEKRLIRQTTSSQHTSNATEVGEKQVNQAKGLTIREYAEKLRQARK